MASSAFCVFLWLCRLSRRSCRLPARPPVTRCPAASAKRDIAIPASPRKSLHNRRSRCAVCTTSLRRMTATPSSPNQLTPSLTKRHRLLHQRLRRNRLHCTSRVAWSAARVQAARAGSKTVNAVFFSPSPIHTRQRSLTRNPTVARFFFHRTKTVNKPVRAAHHLSSANDRLNLI